MNTILDKLDKFFEAQKENEQKLFFLLPLIVIGFIVYYFVYPITDDMLSDSLNKNRNLINQINSKNSNILRVKNSIVRLKNAKHKLIIENKKLTVIQTKMQSLINRVKFLIFDLNRWANIYNTIPKYVKNNNLLLLKLDNKLFLDNKDTKLITLKMQITVTVVGNFKNAVKLINSFEARKNFVKIISFKTDGVISSITINIYGAKL